MQKALIIFETRKGSTQQIAETIQESMKQSGIEVQLKRVSEVEIPELADYDCVVLGSATYNKDMIGIMRTFLFWLEKANLKGKVGASFGAYGWSGEAVEMLSNTMINIFGMDVIVPKTKLAGSASGVGKAEYQDFGRKIAQKIKEKQK